MLRSRLSIAYPLVFVLFCACGEDETSLEVEDGCNPLGGVTCMMPWPSSAYLTEADTPTGYQVDIPMDAMPINFEGSVLDPAPFNRFDGFAPSGAIVAAFPNGVSAEGLPPHRNPAASLEPDSPTVVINMETGERLLHFAEVDMNTIYPEERVLIIRPLIRMEPSTRYVVAIRNTVKDADGQDLPVPEGFRALRDGDTVSHPLMSRVSSGSDAIFTALEADGISRDELVLAWDFVTASDEFLTGDMLSMRSQALPVMEAGLTFAAEEVAADPSIYRSLIGTHQAPNFLSNGEEDDSILLRDGSDLPMLSGNYDANFAAIIPDCVTDPQVELPVPVMIFGHGLFGTGADYLDDGFLQEIANQFCFVVVAGDFIGLTERQVAMVAYAANDLNRAPTISSKLAQSIINFIALDYMIRDTFVDDPLFQYQNRAILDTDRVHYLGASLGGIMGNVFMAYDPNIERGALGVPGGAWSLLFERSLAWGPLQVVAKAAYPDDPYSYEILTSLLAMSFEPIDPITTTPRVVMDPLPDTPAKQILMYQTVGDSLVSNLSTEMVARTMGIDLVAPSLYVPYGLDESTEPLTSGLTIYDEHPEPLPNETNVPPNEDNGTHAGVHERAAVLRQLEGFFFDGVITNTCELDGQSVPCDCATGACD